ncbi:unnamed protein product [Caretta caretta]
MLPSDRQGFRKGEPVMRAAWECMCHHQPSYIKGKTSMDSSIRCPQGRLGTQSQRPYESFLESKRTAHPNPAWNKPARRRQAAKTDTPPMVKPPHDPPAMAMPSEPGGGNSRAECHS